MYQDNETGVWNTSVDEEQWAYFRARELAADEFDVQGLRAQNWVLWIIEGAGVPRAADAFREFVLEALTGRRADKEIDALRQYYIDEQYEEFMDEAWEELQDHEAA